MKPRGVTDLALARAGVERAAHRRIDDHWLASAWHSDNARVFRIRQGSAEVAGDPPTLRFRSATDDPLDRRYFLGVDPDQRPYFAVEVDAGLGDEGAFRDLREVGQLLGARDAGLMVNAIALANWHATHSHCPRCGGPTRPVSAGHLRLCDADGSEHYPRTDPAVIMAVIDDRDRILLGRQARWQERRFSTLAGFVEPGESLEQAVRREVAEEVGLSIGAVRYLGSQPWPFPSSLMLGFEARAETTEIRLLDGEIAQAQWLARDDLTTQLARGDLLLPPRVSIARRLIEHWYGEILHQPQSGG